MDLSFSLLRSLTCSQKNCYSVRYNWSMNEQELYKTNNQIDGQEKDDVLRIRIYDNFENYKG